VEKLDQLGRLLGTVRLLDMHLADDRQVDWYVEQFMQGNYQFETDRAPHPQRLDACSRLVQLPGFGGR